MVYHTSNDILTEFVDCVVLRVTESNEKVINKTPSFGNRTRSLLRLKINVETYSEKPDGQI
jgi:hypothetical protein